MGIGRLEFIRLSGLALAGTIIDPLQAVTTHNNIYINKKLGILFNVPKNWGFIKVQDFGKLKEKQILDGGFEYIKDEVYEDLGDPICIVTKYYQDLPEHDSLFSPTITLEVHHESEIEGSNYIDLKALCKISELGVSNLLKDFKVIKRYEPYKISDCIFYEYDATYLFEHVDLDIPLTVDLKVLKAKHNNYFYSFNCHQSIEKNQIAHKEFEKFKKSIKLI